MFLEIFVENLSTFVDFLFKISVLLIFYFLIWVKLKKTNISV